MTFASASSGDGSAPAEILVVLAAVAVVYGAVYAAAAARRARSRRAHAHVEATGHGAWEGTISDDDETWLFPESTVGWCRSFLSYLLTEGGSPVTLEVDPQGLRLRLTAPLMRHAGAKAWFAPWTDVAACTTAPVGFRTIRGKLSVVRLTDVLITVVADSARGFLEFWALEDDAEDDAEDDEPPLTPDELAEDAQWFETVKSDLGPAWTPGTALLRVRVSASDGVVEAVSRWARGGLPEAS